jgi:pentapeptide MXKDX repeat protein
MNRMVKSKRLVRSIAAAGSASFLGLILCAGPALADDSMSQVTMSKSQQLKDCMERQKTADVTQSKAEMKRICKDQLKQQKQTGALPEAPPTDTPKQ